jgi:glycosyltransferase involved in cell wall biosynthesis
MASGLPVVAADVGQVSEVVTDGIHGRLYPPGNRAALAEALLEVLNNREDARRMARAGRSWTLENATWSRRVDSILGRVTTIGSGGSWLARRSP